MIILHLPHKRFSIQVDTEELKGIYYIMVKAFDSYDMISKMSDAELKAFIMFETQSMPTQNDIKEYTEQINDVKLFINEFLTHLKPNITNETNIINQS